MKIPLQIRQECIKLSSEKKTIQEVSDILNISRGSVLNIRKESNLIFNKLGEHKRVHFYNEDFFKNIDSPTKAYWLGFIFADGCLYAKSNCLSIGLARKDRNILEKFIKCIGGDSSKIFDRSQKSKKNGNKRYETSIIRINSKKIYQDLINLGAFPNKSLTLNPPKIDKIYFKDFLLGYFDGDGHVSKKANLISIACSLHMAEWISSFLSEYSIENKIRSHGKIYYVDSYGIINIRKFIALIYSSHEIPYLLRKKEIFLSKKNITSKENQQKEILSIKDFIDIKMSYKEMSEKTGLSINRIHYLIKCKNKNQQSIHNESTNQYSVVGVENQNTANV